MNREQRYHCASHPDITVGATSGHEIPPSCQFCRRPMQAISPGPGVGNPNLQPPSRDPRQQRPPRGGAPL